jgi:hypothetical protein
MLTNGQTVRLMDLTSLDKKITSSLEKGKANYNSRLTVSENQVFGTIGTTRPTIIDKFGQASGGDGLHVTVIKKGMHADLNSYNRNTSGVSKDTTSYLIDPLERGSPLRCPEYPTPNNKIIH